MKGTTSKSKITEEQIANDVNNSGKNTFLIKRSRQDVGRSARTMYRVRHGNGPNWDMPNNDIESVAHAVLERVFFVKKPDGFKTAPKPYDLECFPDVEDADIRRIMAREYVQHTTKSFRSKMKSLIDLSGQVSPMTNEEFLSCYGGAKLRVYQAAVESLNTQMFSAQDCVVKTFTKDEYRKPGGAPRAIQPRSPRFNVMLGRYIKHLEHSVFENIDKIFDATGSHKTVAKGMNMIERGNTISDMWDSFSDPVAIGLDASRFDQHINSLLLEIEHDIYRSMSTGNTPGDGLVSLNRLLAAQTLNKGKYQGVDGTIKYQVEGNRMSGDMNTSLGNVIIMCTLMYSYLEYKGLLSKAKLLNDGDDCVLIMNRKDSDIFREGMEYWFRRVGITMCYDGIYTQKEQIEFCQAKPVFDDKLGYRLVPRPSKRLYSDLVSTKPLHSRKVYNKWVGAVAGCGSACSSGLPIFQEFYRWLARTSRPWIPEVGDYYHTYRSELVKGMSYKLRPISWDTRISFYLAHDVTPEEQILVEKYYRELKPNKWKIPTAEKSCMLDAMQHLVYPEQAFSLDQ